MAEIQSGNQKELQCECNTTPDNYLEDVLDSSNIPKEEKREITKLINQYRLVVKKNAEIKHELNELGKGTTFLDCEKLRKDIYDTELKIYYIKEAIRHKTESMQEAKARDQVTIQTEKDGLRTLKKQCEDALKLRKKELKDQLDKKRHNMVTDEKLREEADMTKKDWEKEVKVQTVNDEKQNEMKLEGLRLEQEKNIKKMETSIAEHQEVIEQKYGAIEEEIRKLKDTVKLKEIGLHDLEMARENRLKFAEINNQENVTCEQHFKTDMDENAPSDYGLE